MVRWVVMVGSRRWVVGAVGRRCGVSGWAGSEVWSVKCEVVGFGWWRCGGAVGSGKGGDGCVWVSVGAWGAGLPM